MALNRSLRISLLVISNLLVLLACYIFAKGFFPYKPLLSGVATFQEQDALEELEMLAPRVNGTRAPLPRPIRAFDKVVFMVVDALRSGPVADARNSDFVYGHQSGFKFTQGLIREGAAFPFTAHAAPPTVTMPRVKALTTGSVPSFVDLILNFAESDTSSSLASQDTWLAQIREHIHGESSASKRSGQLHFFGDDTWLKLFPAFFAKHDGTSSFFVSDFTEVDNNVTRHLPSTLKSREWDAVIMHYLGLDHIGHKTGPEGPNMLPKQAEMDGIVKQIFTAIETESHLEHTLLVVAGDHGMNSAGNHGGSGPGETDTALVFLSPKFRTAPNSMPRTAPTDPLPGTEFDYYRKIPQSDLVPTLSALLGIPVPKNNLGIIIDELMSPWQSKRVKGLHNPYLQLLYRNALQVLEILRHQYGKVGFTDRAGVAMTYERCRIEHSPRHQLRCMWARIQRMILAADVMDKFTVDEQADAIKGFLRLAQDELGAAASSYDLRKLVGGSAIALTAAILAFVAAPLNIRDGVAVPTLYAITVLYGIMMFATSFVEEEQHIWYWASGAWLLYQTVSRLSNDKYHPLWSIGAEAFITLCLFRIARGWNQTGQKFAGAPDIVNSFLSKHTDLLWILVTISYLLPVVMIGVVSLSDLLDMFDNVLNFVLALVLGLALTATVMVFKIKFTIADAPELTGSLLAKVQDASSHIDLVTNARLIFSILGGIAVIILVSHATARLQGRSRQHSLAARLTPVLLLLLYTQCRTTNIPLLCLQFTQVIAPVILSARHDAASPSPSNTGRIGAYASTSLTILLASYSAFFQSGGTNAISSIDLSSAYNGVDSYNIVAVGVLLFLANWAGPIACVTAGVVRMQQAARSHEQLAPVPVDTTHVPAADAKGHVVAQDAKPSPGPEDTRKTIVTQTVGTEASAFELHAAVTTLFTAASMTATMVACTVLRTHLFIWTVFSPKYLYAVAWAVGWHGVVNLGWGGLLWLAG